MVLELFKRSKGKQLALLIDPDKHTDDSLLQIAERAQSLSVNYIFVGGSLLHVDLEHAVSVLKQKYTNPIVLFPGGATQVVSNVDAILFLSLISGRNPEFLIGNHVIAAPIIKKSGVEVIPTGYMLIDGGNVTSVEYISNTRPIPSDKADIAVATALAGEMLGMKALYLEAGSGAKYIVNTKIISKVRAYTDFALIVGGGIKTVTDLQTVFDAGADIAVVGTSIEQNPEILTAMMTQVKSYDK